MMQNKQILKNTSNIFKNQMKDGQFSHVVTILQSL